MCLDGRRAQGRKGGGEETSTPTTPLYLRLSPAASDLASYMRVLKSGLILGILGVELWVMTSITSVDYGEYVRFVRTFLFSLHHVTTQGSYSVFLTSLMALEPSSPLTQSPQDLCTSSYLSNSVRESKVQSLIPLIRCRFQVLQLLVLSHRIPLGVTALVAPHIVGLGQEIQSDIHHGNAEEGPITAIVIGCIIWTPQ